MAAATASPRNRLITFFSVVGARPQFIKAAVIERAIRGLPARARLRHALIHTGQHFEAAMSEIFFRDLALPKPMVHLGLGGLARSAQLGRMLEQLAKVFAARAPDVVLVYGDTTSTLAGALAASSCGIPIAHVEAGLRSFNRQMPEEINRILTDHLATWLFCPSRSAAKQLAAEGMTQGVHVVGDVMVDALEQARPWLGKRRRTILRRWGLREGGYYLATLHRAENTDDPQAVIKLLHAFASFQQPVLLPVHPRTRNLLAKAGWQAPRQGALRLLPPVSYPEMLVLEGSAKAILTDSGGVQKEAYWWGVPCLTLRQETEWVETVHSGWNRLIGIRPTEVCRAVRSLNGVARSPHPAFYGQGDAGRRLVTRLWRDVTRDRQAHA